MDLCGLRQKLIVRGAVVNGPACALELSDIEINLDIIFPIFVREIYLCFDGFSASAFTADF